MNSWQFRLEMEEFAARLREYANKKVTLPDGTIDYPGQRRAERFADRDYDRAIKAFEEKTGRSWETYRNLSESDMLDEVA